VCVCVCARVLFARVVIIFEVPEVFIVYGLNVVSNLFISLESGSRIAQIMKLIKL